MTIKQQGGIFGRNPTFNDVDVEGTLTVDGLPITGGNGTMAAQDANAVAITGGNIDGTIIGASSTAALSATTGTFSTVYASTSVAVGAAANYQATFYKAGANANYVQVSNGMLGAGAGNGILYGVDASGNGVLNKQGTGDLITTVAGIERLRILQAGTFDVSAANIAFDSGYGIDFSATAGTGTSELFDDYEEGTWTPQDSVNAALTTTRATYVKIGQLVVLSFNFTYSATASSLVKNLPFTASNDGYGSGFVSYSTSGIAQGILVNANTSTFDFTDLKSSFPSVANAQLMGTVIYTA